MRRGESRCRAVIEHDAIVARAQKVQTLGEAAKYMQSVEDKIVLARDVSAAAKRMQV